MPIRPFGAQVPHGLLLTGGFSHGFFIEALSLLFLPTALRRSRLLGMPIPRTVEGS
jgi:hypothetical protein